MPTDTTALMFRSRHSGVTVCSYLVAQLHSVVELVPKRKHEQPIRAVHNFNQRFLYLVLLSNISYDISSYFGFLTRQPVRPDSNKFFRGLFLFYLNNFKQLQRDSGIICLQSCLSTSKKEKSWQL